MQLGGYDKRVALRGYLDAYMGEEGRGGIGRRRGCHHAAGGRRTPERQLIGRQVRIIALLEVGVDLHRRVPAPDRVSRYGTVDQVGDIVIDDGGIARIEDIEGAVDVVGEVLVDDIGGVAVVGDIEDAVYIVGDGAVNIVIDDAVIRDDIVDIEDAVDIVGDRVINILVNEGRIA
jgi:hypothetical protein